MLNVLLILIGVAIVSLAIYMTNKGDAGRVPSRRRASSPTSSFTTPCACAPACPPTASGGVHGWRVLMYLNIRVLMRLHAS